LTIIVVEWVVKLYAVVKISQIYCWGILIWATLRTCIKSRKSIQLIRRIKPESELTGKLFQMLTTHSVKNEERTSNAAGMLFVQFIGVSPCSARRYPH